MAKRCMNEGQLVEYLADRDLGSVEVVQTDLADGYWVRVSPTGHKEPIYVSLFRNPNEPRVITTREAAMNVAEKLFGPGRDPVIVFKRQRTLSMRDYSSF